MNNKTTRRDFLKISGATIIGGAAAYTGIQHLNPEEAHANDKGDVIVPSFCEVCFWKCGILAHKKNGKIYKITGNPNHPISNGMLCPRGVGGHGQLEDPDRLKKPLIRVKKNGKDMWKPVSWDEALEYTAKRLIELRDKYGPEQLGYFSHGFGATFFNNLVKAYGCGHNAHPSYDQCRGPRDDGFILTFGDTPGSPEKIDLQNAKCVAFIGSHLGENMHNSQVQDLSIGNSRGAVFITVDPRKSIIATKSKYWLPIKPATDMALLLAWAHVMINEGIYQKEFVAKNVEGFEAFKKHVQKYTPEWAAKETDLDAEDIRKTARELAKAAPAALIHPGRHVTWYGDDAQRSRMIAILNGLLGNWYQKGGFHKTAGVTIPPYKLPAFPDQKMLHNSDTEKYNAVTHHLRTQAVVDASIPRKNEPYIHSWFVYASNLPMTMGNTEYIYDVMKKLEFSVVVDVMPAEVTGYADVVLPECTYLERYDDLHAGAFRTPFVAIRQPVVDPMYDSKPGWWIAKKLSEKMDKVLVEMGREKEFEKYFPWKDMEDYIKTRLSEVGLPLTYLKSKGVYAMNPIKMYEKPAKLKFETPSGKVEFYSKQLAKHGYDPMPVFKKHPEPEKGFFRLINGRSPVHSFTRTVNNRRLLKLFSENELWVNTEVANGLGLKQGEYVSLVNQDNVKSGTIKVKVTGRIRKDCVYMVHGFGREDKRLEASYNIGINDNRLNTHLSMDSIMGGTGFRNNFVKIVRS